MNELEVIARLVPHLAARGADLVMGAGEDDAETPPRSPEDLRRP